MSNQLSYRHSIDCVELFDPIEKLVSNIDQESKERIIAGDFNLKITGLFPPSAALASVFHSPPPLYKIRPRHSRKLKLTGLTAYVMFYEICTFESLTIINDVIMTQGTQENLHGTDAIPHGTEHPHGTQDVIMISTQGTEQSPTVLNISPTCIMISPRYCTPPWYCTHTLYRVLTAQEYNYENIPNYVMAVRTF